MKSNANTESLPSPVLGGNMKTPRRVLTKNFAAHLPLLLFVFAGLSVVAMSICYSMTTNHFVACYSMATNHFVAAAIVLVAICGVYGFTKYRTHIKDILSKRFDAKKKFAEHKGSIEGLDAAKGMVNPIARLRQYEELLELYCRNIRDRMAVLSTDHAESDIKGFIKNVHALKSVSAGLGATGISDYAAAMESAGQRGDMGYIRGAIGGFRDELAKLVEKMMVLQEELLQTCNATPHGSYLPHFMAMATKEHPKTS